MKKIILILVASFVLFSCGKEKNGVKIIEPVKEKYLTIQILNFADESQAGLLDSLNNRIAKMLNDKKYVNPVNPQKPVDFDYIIYINENGKVDKLVVLESPLPEIDRFVANQIKDWNLDVLFEGEPVKSKFNMKFSYFKTGKGYTPFPRTNLKVSTPIPDRTGSPYFIAADKMPQPVGGIAAIQKKIVYPEEAKSSGVEGRVFVKAYINEKGEVDRVKLIKGIGGGCDEAAMQAVKETKFTPALQKGKPVKVQVSVPIIFKLASNGNTGSQSKK